MSEILMVRTATGLTPSDSHQWEKLTGDRIKQGDEVKCNITVPRNLKFLRKYFAMLKSTFDMQDSYTNFEHWRLAVQIAAGHCETFITHTGEVSYKPKSISFARCDETEFDRIYNQAIQAICDYWVKTEPEQLKLIMEFC